MSKWASEGEDLSRPEVLSHWVAHALQGEPVFGTVPCALTGILFLPFRTAEPKSSFNHQLCEKDCVRNKGDEELVRRPWWDEVSGRSLNQDVVTEKGTVGQDLTFSMPRKMWDVAGLGTPT